MATDELAKIIDKIGNPRAREWLRLAFDHASKMDSFIEVKPDTQQYQSWLSYFQRIGWMPAPFKNIEFSKSKSWTAPCEWPSELPVMRSKIGIVA